MTKIWLILLPASVMLAAASPAAPPHVFTAAGIVIFEAEDITTNLSPRSGHQWEVKADIPGFSGDGYMEATPDVGANMNETNWNVASPELQYEVFFLRTNVNHYVWIRGYATDGENNSVHWGVDGATNAASGISWSTFNQWVWTNNGGGSPATISVSSTGIHTFSLWMREDGARIDRVVITTNAGFNPRPGNAWHIPGNIEGPSARTMRFPLSAIYSNTPVTITSGSQYQGSGDPGNQLQTGSAVLYKHATATAWNAGAMLFAGTSGNNIYYTNTIPAGLFKAGDVVQYYLRISYNTHLTTYLYTSGGVSRVTELESAARANPFSYTVQDSPPQMFPSPDDWRDENIYFIFTDRFNDGNPANNNSNPQQAYAPSSSRGIHGGDFKGIERKLDYLKALGATAIWITPVVLNASNSSYHGYGAHDFYQVAPHLGTMTDLSNMVAAAHRNGIRVILDVVCNHTGNRINSGDAGYPTYNTNGYNLRWANTNVQYPPPFNSLTHFHNYGHIQSFTDPQQILGELSGLDDLKTETTYVRTNLVEIYKYWIQNADLDGFRIDTVKHVDIGFWQYFNPQIRAFAASIGKTNFFQFGEVFDGDEGKCGYYTGTKAGGAFANDSVLDYPLYFRLNNVFGTQSPGNTKQIEDHYNAIPTWYDAAAQMRLVTFLDNHDQPRFMSSSRANNNTNRLSIALSFLYTSRGIPCLYYGTEQNFNGSGDPNNREDMFAGQFESGPSVGDNFNMTHGSFQHVARLNNFRRLYPSLRRGSHVNLWNNPSAAGLFAYARRLGSEEVFVVFNNSTVAQTLPARPTTYTAGTKLVNLLNTNESVTVTAAADGIPSISVPATSAKIFIAESLMKPLDPVVAAQTPAHGATNVQTSSSIVLTFSKPMNTNATQAAFSLQPATAGTFTWSSDRMVMTFTPNAGFPGLTTNILRIGTNAVDSVSTNAFFAPFETFFRTAAAAFTDNVPPTVTIAQPANAATVSGVLVLAGSAADNVQVQKVEVQLDNSGWLAATGTTAWSFGLDSELFLNGTHTLSARATDSSGNVSTTALITVKFFNVPGAYVRRISAGNPNSVTDCVNNVWVKDQPYSFGSFGFIGGLSGVLNNAISGICAEAQSLYQRERYSGIDSSFRYLFDCPDGIYQIRLLEAETYLTGPNQRIFDLYIEGVRTLTNFDIFAEAGGMNIPLELIFTNAITDSQIELHFLPWVDSARASGIEVKKIGDVDADGDGVPDWWMLGYFDHPTGQVADQSRAEDDADGDSVSNLGEYLAGTDPLDPESFPRIDEILADPEVWLRFYARSGRVYAVEYSSEGAGATNWSQMPVGAVETNGWRAVPDTNVMPVKVYRLRIEKP